MSVRIADIIPVREKRDVSDSGKGHALVMCAIGLAFLVVGIGTPREAAYAESCAFAEVCQDSCSGYMLLGEPVGFEVPETLKKIGDASVKAQIQQNDVAYYLLPTFDDPRQALENVKRGAPSVIACLKSTYHLEDLSEGNWKYYYNAMYDLLDLDVCPDWYGEANNEFQLLQSFFDLYENEQDNREMLELVELQSSAQKLNLTNDADAFRSEILLRIPDQTVLGESLDISLSAKAVLASGDFVASSSRVAAKFSVSKGIDYAKKYAVHPNKSKYQHFAADCTNFASQILEAGGVKQAVTTSVKSGWWHKAKLNGRGDRYVHTHSNSWIRANDFARYIGKSAATKSFNTISANVKTGDFIGADWVGDGAIDHIGFVVAKSAKTKAGYYNLRIAQHTKNYIDWVSSSQNNWEITPNKGKTTYYRIRK